MISKQFFNINEQYRSRLEALNLTSFEQLMNSTAGDILESEASRESRRIEHNGEVAYLKKQFFVAKKPCIETNLLLHKAHTPAVNEHIYIRQLKQQEFAVMNVMAVGEQRRCGFPSKGFILVDEVKGQQLDRLLNDIDDEKNTHSLLVAYGELIARLHQYGFYAPLRIKDIIVTDDKHQPLVMIDREIRNPYPRFRSKRRAARSLRDAFKRTRREFKKFNDEMELIIVQAYDNYQPS